jgi:outer membrane protein TolC
VDVITAQLPTAQARLALVQQQGVEIGAQAALANSMGLDANTVVRPADDSSNYQDIVATTLNIPTYDRAIQQAYLLRPDLQAAQKAVEAAQFNVRSARQGHSPTLTGNATEQVGSTGVGGGGYRNQWTVQALVTIPMYDGGQTNSLVSQAQANLNSTLASYTTTQLGVQLNVKQALTTLISARSALDAAQTAYVNASTILQATQAQYRAGVTTLPLLLNAQVGLTSALTSQVNAIYTLRQAEQSFLYAIGQNA